MRRERLFEVFQDLDRLLHTCFKYLRVVLPNDLPYVLICGLGFNLLLLLWRGLAPEEVACVKRLRRFLFNLMVEDRRW